MFAKKRPQADKPAEGTCKDEAPKFQLIKPNEPPLAEDEEMARKKSQVRKLAEQYSDPLDILSQVLREQRKPKTVVESRPVAEAPSSNVPKALPTVDFGDDKPAKKKRDAKNNQKNLQFEQPKPTIKTGMPKTEKPKKKKEKFSKLTNPFPNDPSKKPKSQAIAETKAPKPSDNVQTKAVSSEDTVFTKESMDDIQIHPHAIKNLKDIFKFTKLTHVQQKAIPAAVEGRDLLIRSPTGSGKTLSYALPIVDKLCRIEPKITRQDGIHALVIVPTRELVIQVYETFLKLVKPFQWIVPGYLSGGEKRKAEKARLRKGVTILISTPGRICDHLLHTEVLKFDKVQVFVLDEADRLLELGYENDVKKVVDMIGEHSKLTKNIQTILLSATLTSKVKQLAGLTLSNPVVIDNDAVNQESIDEMSIDENIQIPAGITQTYYMLPQKTRFIVLCCLLAQQFSKKGAKKVLIFLPTQHVVDYFYDILVEFLTQPFVKRERSAKSYLKAIDGELMEDEDEESDEEDAENIWLTNVTIFK